MDPWPTINPMYVVLRTVRTMIGGIVFSVGLDFAVQTRKLLHANASNAGHKIGIALVLGLACIAGGLILIGGRDKSQ